MSATVLSVLMMIQNDLIPTDAKLVKLGNGLQFTEGPVWIDRDEGYLVFSDIPADRMLRWSDGQELTTFRKPSHNANGNTLDREGRLITCEHGSRRVTRTDRDGKITALFESFEGKKLNSPNDVVVKSDGSIWFTDPTYGIKRELMDQPGCYVYRGTPDGKALAIVAPKDFDMPNGLCFSPDQQRLYVADSGRPRHIRVFDVAPDGKSLVNGRVFCEIEKGAPDGIRCDEHGNVWSTAGDGVDVFSPAGELILKIPVPETPANLCFGGADRKTLFITARTSIYSIRVNVAGSLP